MRCKYGPVARPLSRFFTALSCRRDARERAAHARLPPARGREQRIRNLRRIRAARGGLAGMREIFDRALSRRTRIDARWCSATSRRATSYISNNKVT